MKGETKTMKYKISTKMKRFEGQNVFQIVALTNFGNVKKGEKGGWIAKESNLSQEGDCWVYPNGIVAQDAVVRDDAIVYNGFISESAIVDKDAVIGWRYASERDMPRVAGNAHITDFGKVRNHAYVGGFAVVKDAANISDYAIVRDHASIEDDASVFHNAIVFGNAIIEDRAFACNHAMVGGDAILSEHCCVASNTVVMTGEHVCVENKKYVLDKEDTIEVEGHTLYRIIALNDGAYYHNGEKGGYIEKEDNLSHNGHCWVSEGNVAFGDTVIEYDMVL